MTDPTLDALKHLATQKGALLDAFQQIDRLRERVDSHYLKIVKMIAAPQAGEAEG